MTLQEKVSQAPGTGHEFMEKTKYRYIGKSDQQRGLPQPPLELPPGSHARMIDLPRPESLRIPPLDLRAAIERRRSVRSYLKKPITLEELSFLLWCTQGVQQVMGARLHSVRSRRPAPATRSKRTC